MNIMKKACMLLYLLFLELKRIIFGVKYFAEVDVTDNCNLRCKHCYHFSGKDELKTMELPLDVWKERFSGLHKVGIRFILLVGGEPALRHDVLMLADEIFPYIQVITNGTLKIHKEFDHILFVSVDGKEERNDSIRGNGVFSRLIKNYSGDKRVIINMTIKRDNYKELEDIVNIAKKNRFRGVVCNIYTPTVGKSSSFFITKDERKRIIDELRRVKSLYPNYFLLTKPIIEWYEFPNHAGFCYWGDEALHYDVLWNRRRCFTGLDCSNCGCFAGAVQSPLRLIVEPFMMLKFI